MRTLVLVLALSSATAFADEPVRVLLSVGNDIGDPTDAPLRFAEADAERFLQLMVDIGQVKPERATLAVGLDAHQVREKLAELKGRVAELEAAGKQTMLLLYVSAHAQGGELHLKGTHLPLLELREFTESTGAQLRLVFVDACDSGLLSREKGMRPGKDFDVTVQATAAKGQVLISSSGPAEAAQEWDLLQGSLFTHHLLTGLRGDADTDRDGAVTLTEAYQYTWRRTVAQAVSRGQHPTFDFDLTGSTDVALSRPKGSRAAVVFAAGISGHFVVASQPRPDVVAELHKSEGQSLRLALPPGRYVVRQLLGSRIGLIDFDLPFGGEFQVDPAQLHQRHFSEVATKGGYVQVRPSQVALGAALESPQLSGAGPRARLELQARRGLESWLLGVGVGVGYWRFRGVGLSTEEWNIEPWAEAGYRFLGLSWTPTIGIRAGLDLRNQSFVRDQEQLIRSIGGATLPSQWSTGVLFGPFVGAELSLSERWLLGARFSVQARWLVVNDQLPWTAVAQGNLYVGWRF